LGIPSHDWNGSAVSNGYRKDLLRDFIGTKRLRHNGLATATHALECGESHMLATT
jgi:hypothetical protein